MLRKKHAPKKEPSRKLSRDEEVMRFVMKAVGSAALFFVVAIGMDAYHFFH
ncbi:MAG: hypothetical protein WAV46_00300 [Candidatus Moraniibacteriota bacterium]